MNEATNHPVRDTFRDRLAEAQAETGKPKLAHQSLGRPLSSDEEAFADALMAIYADGVTEPDAVAERLTANGIISPVSGANKWTAQSLEEGLRHLNEDLDAAYQENGFGA